jgi:hypothetical protein
MNTYSDAGNMIPKSSSLTHVAAWWLILFWSSNFTLPIPLAEAYRLTKKIYNWTPRPESGSKLYWPSDRRLSAKLVATFADRRCHLVSMTDPYDRNLRFLDRNRYYFFQVAFQLYSRDWVDPVPDPLLLTKPGSSGNRTRTSGYVARNSDH